MTSYRYLAHDLRTNSLLAELPLNGVGYGAKLNYAGSFSATLQLGLRGQTSPGVWAGQAADLLTATVPARTVITVVRDDVPIDSYIVWKRGNYNAEKRTLQIAGQSLISYFARRKIFSTTTFTSVDQLTIARTLIANAQAELGGNIGVSLDATTSGILRDRTYWGYEAKGVYEAVQQMSQVNNGFDFAIDITGNPTSPTRTLNLAYPFRGRNQTNTGHVFETGRNIQLFDYGEDATVMATRYRAIGVGSGDSSLLSTQSRTDIIDQGWPLLDDSGAMKDVSIQATLDDHALAAVNARANIVTIPQVVVYSGADPQLGAWIVGDWAKFVYGSDPDKPDVRFPQRTEQFGRIVAFDATPGDEGQELVKLTVN